MAFGGKTHAVQLAMACAFAGGNAGQDVGVFNKLQRGHVAAAVFFDFVHGRIGRPPVCHRSGRHKYRS